MGDELIGVATKQAARVVGVSVQRLASWERHDLVVPHLSERIGPRTVRVYRLDDLVEACLVKALEDRGCSLRQVRRVVDAHRSAEAPRPLRHLRWATEGSRIYVQYPDGSWYGGHRPRQGVMRETLDLEEIRTRARDRALARAGTPGEIERRPRTMGRKPVFAGTRTPVATVQAYLREGIPDEEILEAFPHLRAADLETARRLLSA
jgi:uncharacterized protein (DUF433 family)